MREKRSGDRAITSCDGDGGDMPQCLISDRKHDTDARAMSHRISCMMPFVLLFLSVPKFTSSTGKRSCLARISFSKI